LWSFSQRDTCSAGDVAIDTGRARCGREGFAHGRHRFAIPFDNRMSGDAEPFPAPQVRQQPCRQSNGRLAFIRLTGAKPRWRRSGQVTPRR